LSGGWLGLRLRSGVWRRTAVTASVFVGVGLFALWRCSLYGGTDYETEFSWSSGVLEAGNVAYGRQTELVGSDPEDVAIQCAPSRAVDGDTRPGTGFETECRLDPAWSLDLGRARRVRRVEIFVTPAPGFGMNSAPLRVQLSLDGRRYREIGEFGRSGERPVSIALGKGVEARYLRVNATGDCVLLLDEVRVLE